MKKLSDFRLLLFILPLGLLLFGAPSCAWYAPASADRVFVSAPPPPAGSEWPARSTNRLDDIIHMGPECLAVRVEHSTLRDGRVTRSLKKLPPGETGYSAHYGRGILRFYRAPEDQENTRTVASGMYFFSGVEVPPETAKRRWTISAPPTPDTATAEWVVNLRGTWMRLEEPTDRVPRGLVVHLTSYGGYRFEKPVIRELQERGWAVLWVDSSTIRAKPTRIDADTRDLGPAAAAIASNIDDRVSELAYAVEAALEYIQNERPEIPRSPLVLTGYSAGALAAPAVAALMPGRVDAAVLIGGGANLLDISQRSALTDGGLKIDWIRGQPTAKDRRRLARLYLESSRLDPYWSAAFLRDKPVLMLHAVLDRIVPASCGDLLHERLGRPERVTFLLGHELLFFRLPAQATMIANWIDQTVGQKTAQASQ